MGTGQVDKPGFPGKEDMGAQREKPRVILHCDCNSYFASVECIFHPEWKEVPMAVCGDPASRHGIILAKNELAKRFGIQTAETIWQAKRKCPELVLAPSHHSLYEEFSERINGLYQEYTDRVEPFSIDESWLDLTSTADGIGEGTRIADELRERIRAEIGVTISVGVSFNKVFAKIGSDYRKPDATTVIAPENFQEIVWPLPARDMLFVGRSASERLERIGIRTIGEIAGAGKETMQLLLGKTGETIWKYAMGLDSSPVQETGRRDAPKSIGSSFTFPTNLTTMEDIQAGLLELADQVGTRLRRHALFCTTIAIQIRNPDFHTVSRQMGLPSATNSTRAIFRAACELAAREWKPGTGVRMLSVTGTGLTGTVQEQMSLLEEVQADTDKSRKLDSAVDEIRRRFGKDAISFGSLITKQEDKE